jgi:hypothetical protein
MPVWWVALRTPRDGTLSLVMGRRSSLGEAIHPVLDFPAFDVAV